MHFPFWPHDLYLGPEPRLRDPTLHFLERGLYGHQHHAFNLSSTIVREIRNIFLLNVQYISTIFFFDQP